MNVYCLWARFNFQAWCNLLGKQLSLTTQFIGSWFHLIMACAVLKENCRYIDMTFSPLYNAVSVLHIVGMNFFLASQDMTCLPLYDDIPNTWTKKPFHTEQLPMTSRESNEGRSCDFETLFLLRTEKSSSFLFAGKRTAYYVLLRQKIFWKLCPHCSNS